MPFKSPKWFGDPQTFHLFMNLSKQTKKTLFRSVKELFKDSKGANAALANYCLEQLFKRTESVSTFVAQGAYAI